MKLPQSGERKVIRHCFAISFTQIATQYNQVIVLGGSEIAVGAGGCRILLKEDYSMAHERLNCELNFLYKKTRSEMSHVHLISKIYNCIF